LTERLRLVVIFAHPDDESFGFAGLLSAFSDAGHESTCVVGTLGEAGEILVPGLATPENLAEVRERELREALEILGVGDLRMLGYRDSGMAGTVENADPRAYINQDVDAVAERVAGILVEKQPDIVLTYGPDGIYGHPDHIMAHKVGTAAVMLAAETGWRVPSLYYSALSKGRLRWIVDRQGGAFAGMTGEALAALGTPHEEITTWMDVSAFYPRKLRALRAHRSQVGDDGPLANLTEAEREFWFSLESARMIPLPWNPDPTDVFASLLPPVPADQPFRS
jgi:LmbE family N-acetylglucosaminyl deacetylase